MCRQRKRMGYGAQMRASYQLTQNILKHPLYHHSQHVAFYWPVNGEIDVRPLLKKAWSQGKTCYLPVIEGERLVFARYMPASPMALNKFGIPEPASGDRVLPQRMDLVLVPLVAFDQHSHRIGMGGGFYDKTFARDKCRRHIPLMGVAHRYQLVHGIVPEHWDVKLDQVITN